MSKGRPRKNGERTACGALKRVADNGLTPTAIKRISEDLARGAGDKRFETEVARLLFERKINDREAAAAFRVGEIYGRFERLHGKHRSAVSPSYTIGRAGAPELADERMTDEQVEARDRRERDVEAAFAALQDEVPPYPAKWRAMLEHLCVDNLHVPEIWLPELRWMLERIAKAARIPGQKKGERNGSGGKSVTPPRVVPLNRTNGAVSTSTVPRINDDRDAWITLIHNLRPDLDAAALIEAGRFQGALRDRAVLMRERATSS
jgi:hypothetical protein